MSKDKDILSGVDANNIPEELNRAPLGAGRTPKALQLQKYEHVLKRLDDNVDKVMDTLFDLLDSPDPNVRLRVAELLLKKYLPDKKVKEVTGAGGGPVQITQTTDIRAIILQAADIIDEMDIETIRERSRSGNLKIIDINAGTGD